MDTSTPKKLGVGQWHLPYVNLDEEINLNLEILKKISVARCARVSYRAFDGTPSPIEKDLELFDRLLVSQPLHASPAEHQATPDTLQWIQTIAVASPKDYENGDDDETLLHTSEQWLHPELHGNFTGWCQYRKMLPNEFVPG